MVEEMEEVLILTMEKEKTFARGADGRTDAEWKAMKHGEKSLDICLHCGKEYLKIHRIKFCSDACRTAHRREQRKQYGKDNKEYFSDKVKNYAHNNPEKIDAKNKARVIEIPENQLCQRCEKNKATQKHHEDYSKPLEVEFLCRKCHSKADAERRNLDKSLSSKKIVATYVMDNGRLHKTFMYHPYEVREAVLRLKKILCREMFERPNATDSSLDHISQITITKEIDEIFGSELSQ